MLASFFLQAFSRSSFDARPDSPIIIVAPGHQACGGGHASQSP